MTGSFLSWLMLHGSIGYPLLYSLLLLYLFTLIKGDQTDRASAHALVIGAVLAVMVALGQPTGQHSWSADRLVIDALLLGVLCVIALRSPRRYPIAIAAAQLLIVLAGLLGSAGFIAQAKVYAVMAGGAASIQLGAFIIGLIAYRIRRRNMAQAAVFAG